MERLTSAAVRFGSPPALAWAPATAAATTSAFFGRPGCPLPPLPGPSLPGWAAWRCRSSRISRMATFGFVSRGRAASHALTFGCL